MVKLLFSLFFSVVVGRWCYAEFALMFPKAAPAIDYLLDEVQIPTHDQWSQDSTDRILIGAAAVADSMLKLAGVGGKDHSRHASAQREAVSRTKLDRDGFYEFESSPS
jgi:hypothetical protein